MNILFIYPSSLTYGRQKFSASLPGRLILRYVSPPFLDFQFLSLVTPDKHSINLVSEEYTSIDYEGEYDLVGITAGTQNVIRAYEIADEFRRRGTKVVMGGWHASSLPMEAKQHADSVVIGEAEETWPQLLKDFENGKLKPFYKQERPVDLKKLPLVDENKIKKHGFATFIQATRGCPYGCKYCSITNTEHWRVFRTRPIEHVIDELRKIPQKFICFGDSSLTINVKYTKQLFYEMRDLNKKFSADGNIQVLGRDDELLKLAAEAGCIHWVSGFESINPKNIDEFCNKTKQSSDYKKAIKKIKDYGMELYANFMFGFDNDTKDSFKQTLDAIYDWDLTHPNFFILTPYPNTPICHQLEKEGRILTRDWSLYNLHNVVFQPKNMTPEELKEGTLNLFYEFYSTKNVIEKAIKSSKIGFYPFVFSAITNLYFSWTLLKRL
ncbi:MAG: B12-binding domain-containing radical SAM protein [Thermoplasmata archaeon]|nr:MAG: B12-binding domain-containing radical SAM protein [Thermoplasmata archaeon]